MEEGIAVVVEAMVPACLCGQPAPPVILLVAVLGVATLALQLVAMAVMFVATATVLAQPLRMLATLFLDPGALLLARDAVVAGHRASRGGHPATPRDRRASRGVPVLARFGNHLCLRAAGLGQLALPILGLPADDRAARQSAAVAPAGGPPRGHG